MRFFFLSFVLPNSHHCKQINDVCNMLTRDDALKMMMLHVICDGQTQQLTVISLTLILLVGRNEDLEWVLITSLLVPSQTDPFPETPYAGAVMLEVLAQVGGNWTFSSWSSKISRQVTASDGLPLISNLMPNSNHLQKQPMTNDIRTYNEKCNKECIMEGRFDEGA